MTKFSKILLGEYHLFNSRIFTHVLFWLFYYIFFSLLWVKEGNYFRSFELEFVLMPLRIAASYVVLYYLIPRFLLKEKIERFLTLYLTLIFITGILQRVLNYYFHECFFIETSNLIELSPYFRSIVLINTTVMLLSSLKIFSVWRIESKKNREDSEEYLEIKSNKRIYRVLPSEIKFIEGMGNYLTTYLVNRKPLIVYMSLKEMKSILPEKFVRIHKSFIINKNLIDSYNNESVEIDDRIIPIGKSFNGQEL